MFSNLKQPLPPEFVDDVIAFCAMFYKGGVACGVHGEEHQEEMLKKWPREWMTILFTEVGEFGEMAV